MQKRKIKKTLAGLGIAGLVASVGLMTSGCKEKSGTSCGKGSCGSEKGTEQSGSCGKGSCG